MGTVACGPNCGGDGTSVVDVVIGCNALPQLTHHMAFSALRVLQLEQYKSLLSAAERAWPPGVLKDSGIMR